ncbi:hypothetical protein D3C84_363770 [compost metagenome]
MLDFSKVVQRIAIELQLSDFNQWKLFLRPGLGDIKGVLVVRRCLSFAHDLDAYAPFREITLFDGIEQVALGVIRISARQARSLRWSKVLDPLLGLVVPLHPVTLTLSVDEAVSVAAEAMHVTVSIRDTPVGEQDGDLVQRLGRMRPEVPHRLGTLQVALRQTLLGVDKVWKLQWITNEEHGGIVANDVPVAFLGVELQGEPARITLGIGRTTLATHGGKPQESRGLLANCLKQLRAGVLSDIACHGERTVGTRAFGVYTALRDVFTVEVGKLLDQVKVVEQQRATRAGGTGILVIGNRSATGGGKRFVLAHAIFLPLSVLNCRLSAEREY